MKVSEDEGHDVIYGDTDSAMLSIDSEEEAQELEKKINQRYDEFAEEMGMPNHRLEIELEKRYDKIFFKPDTKKRYCGLIGWEDGTSVDGSPKERLDVTGFEYKRSDSPPITKSLQEKLFLEAFEGDTDDLSKYICGIAEDFRHGKSTLETLQSRAGSASLSRVRGRFRDMSRRPGTRTITWGRTMVRETRFGTSTWTERRTGYPTSA